MNYAEFAAYWAKNEAKLRTFARRYLSSLPDCEDVITDVLSAVRADIESDLGAFKKPTILRTIKQALNPHLPPMNYETWAVSESILDQDGLRHYDAEPEEVRDHLAWYFTEYMELEDEPAYPMLRHIDWTAVDWQAVALAVTA